MRSLLISIVLACSLSSTAKADDFQLGVSLKDLKTQVVVNNGVKGVWFNEQDADKVLQVIEVKIPQMIALMGDYNTKLVALQSAVNSYKSANNDLTQASTFHQQMIDNMLKITKPPDPVPWYKTTEFMYIAGIVTGVAATVGVTFLAIDIVKAK